MKDENKQKKRPGLAYFAQLRNWKKIQTLLLTRL